MTGSLMSEELIDLRGRMRRFVDDEVIPAEPAFFEQQERTGFAAAPVLGPLRAAAKAQGLWALGHPKEIGGGGLPFMDFVYLNEIIGRSRVRPGRGRARRRCRTRSCCTSTPATSSASASWRRWWPARSTRRSGLTEPEVAG